MSTIAETTIEADPNVPIIRMTREFAGTPEQLFRAHTDPELFAQWIGPSALQTRIERVGRALRRQLAVRVHPRRGGTRVPRLLPRGPAGPDRADVHLRGRPRRVALETLWFEDLGNGRTRLRTQSLVDSFESRDAWLASGMEVGVNEGYAKLEEMLADGTV